MPLIITPLQRSRRLFSVKYRRAYQLFRGLKGASALHIAMRDKTQIMLLFIRIIAKREAGLIYVFPGRQLPEKRNPNSSAILPAVHAPQQALVKGEQRFVDRKKYRSFSVR